MRKGAVIDATGIYRYSLWRVWDERVPRVAFVMLNPSRADATTNDPTIRRCIGLADSWGYGSVEVVNLFAYRTPHPTCLRQVADPIGADNDRYIQQAAERSQTLILAWGNRGSLGNRNRAVIEQLSELKSLYCLGTTQKGQPRHPLYLPYQTLPRAYPRADISEVETANPFDCFEC